MSFLLRLSVFCLVMNSWLSSATSQDAAKANSYKDDKYDFSIELAAEWKSAPLQGFAVPGILRAAYTSQQASITLFMQEAGQAFDARFLLDESAKAMEKSLGAKVLEKEVVKLDGKTSMWMVVEGKGTGGAIDGQGQTQTTQHWVAVPREKDVLVLLLTSPATSYKQHEKSFGEALKKLKVGGNQTAEQNAAK